MARSVALDPIEKFRFTVKVYEDFKPSLNSTFNLGSGQISAGFSEVVLPKGDITEILYRENIDNTRFLKKPGLIKYEPLILRKGVTTSTELYNWFKKVHNDAALLNTANELLGSINIPPTSPSEFRKDMLISSLDREGNPIKSWFFYNCFPIGYKGGNDFSANIDEKLISELTVTFEAMIEVQGDSLDSAFREAVQAAQDSSIAAAVGFSLSGGKTGGIL